MILYFTGTGNSRYTADMITDLTGDVSVSMNEYIKAGKRADFHSDKPFVFVCPVYVSAIPRIVETFIKEGNFGGSKEAYFIMTCAGGMGACPVYAKKICEKAGFIYRGTAQILMPQNYLVFFKTKQQDEAEKIVDAALPSISSLAEYINNNRDFPDVIVKNWEYISTEMIIGTYYKWFMPTKKFYATNKCIGCGVCEKSCPLNNISLIDGKPLWGKNCTHCMACISSCPKEAVEYGNVSVGKPRNRCRKYVKTS